MSATRNGGLKSAKTLKAKNPDFYKIIGGIGGRNGRTGGFYGNPERARIAGAKGGKVSRRNGVRNGKGKSRTTTGTKRDLAIVKPRWYEARYKRQLKRLGIK